MWTKEAFLFQMIREDSTAILVSKRSRKNTMK